jgi:hypothetical protein
MFFHREAPPKTAWEDRLAGFAFTPIEGGRVRVMREKCGAIASPAGVERAGWLVDGEIAALVDGGFQKFWQAGSRCIPALASQLQTLHAFEEDLREALGLTSFYNTSLGTTNDAHRYDRLSGR